MIKLLFCAAPFAPRTPDPDWLVLTPGTLRVTQRIGGAADRKISLILCTFMFSHHPIPES